MSQITWTSTDGRRARAASFWTGDSPELDYFTGQAIITAAAPLMLAAPISYMATDFFGANLGTTPSPSANILDAAVLVFQTTNAAQIKLVIPGVDPAIFMADRETVNPANANVAAFIAACFTNNLSNRANAGLGGYLRGYRISLPDAPVYRY